MGQYIINGAQFSEQDEYFDQALLEAYQRKHRPLCACVNPPIEVYLARLSSDQVIIKRMPGSGQGHSADCDHYQPPAELSGRGELQSKAIAEDETTGKTTLKLDFSLSKTSISRTMTRTEGKPATVVKSDPKKLNLRSLLDYLWEEAGLTRWSPAMTGKRNWYVIRHHLMNAANKTTAKKQSLSDVLLIPEAFRADDKAGIDARRRQFLAKFSKQGQSQPVGILIGQIKALDKSRFGYKMTIKHLPSQGIFLDEDVLKRLEKNFEDELVLWEQDQDAHVMVAATFVYNSSGNLSIEAVTLMAADANWIPFDDPEERTMIEQLVTERRRFIKGLRYNLPPGEVIATCLLTDTGDNPTALYIDPGIDEEDSEVATAIDQVIEESTFDSIVWRPMQGEILTLPPACQPIPPTDTSKHD